MQLEDGEENKLSKKDFDFLSRVCVCIGGDAKDISDELKRISKLSESHKKRDDIVKALNESLLKASDIYEISMTLSEEISAIKSVYFFNENFK